MTCSDLHCRLQIEALISQSAIKTLHRAPHSSMPGATSGPLESWNDPALFEGCRRVNGVPVCLDPMAGMSRGLLF